MSAGTVSTIIPAYKAAATIRRAVDSALAQTLPLKEIVIIDDGSPDDIAGAVAHYGDRVRLVRKANGGAASARNHGIDLATGDWVAFLDADDYWEPCRLERQFDLVQRHPEVGFLASRFFTEEPGGTRQPPVADDAHLFDKVHQASGGLALAVAHRVWTTTVLIRRNVLGTHRFDEHLKTAEDIDLWIRLVLAAPTYLISEPLATAVLTPGSLSRSNVAGDYENMLQVLRRHTGLLDPAGVRAWELKLFREWAAGHLGHGEPRAALRPALQRLSRQPWSLQGWWILCKAAVLATKNGPRLVPESAGR